MLISVTALVMSIFLSVQFYYANQQMEKDLAEKAENVVSRISSALNPSIWNIYRKSIDRTVGSSMASAILDAELSDPYLIGIRVYGNFGHLYMGKVKLQNGEIVQYDEFLHENYLHGASQKQTHPIKNGVMTIGRVEVFFTHAPYQKRLRQSLFLEVGQIGVLALVFVIFLYQALKKALLKPMESLQVAQRAFESLGEAVVVMAPDKSVIDVNPAFLEVTGYQKDDVLGAKLDLLEKSRSPQLSINEIWASVDEFDDWSGEIVGRGKDNIRFPAWMTIDAVHNAAGDLISYVSVFRDISQQKKAEQKLQNAYLELEDRIRERTEELSIAKDEADDANKAKSDFLARMSHELRTPLNAIIGITEMVMEDAADHGREDITEPLQRVHGAGLHLLELINDILDFSKIEAGKMEINVIEFNFVEFLKDVELTVRPLTAKNDNSFKVTGADRILTMICDPVRLKQALYNLLSNAAKFTEGGTIHLDISVERAGNGHDVLFSIHDSGMGIPAEHMDKLFVDFTQLDINKKRASGGTGLGLSISKRLAGMMGGDIYVKSTEGVGSTFTLRLPLHRGSSLATDDGGQVLAGE